MINTTSTVQSKSPTDSPLLLIENLHVGASTAGGELNLVRGFEIQIYRGERWAILGESGSGKTVSMSAAIGLNPSLHIQSGSVQYRGEEISSAASSQLHRYRGRGISFVMQNPSHALNPHRDIRSQIHRMLKRNALPIEGISEALDQAGIEDPDRVLAMKSGQLSGGLSQRVMVAMMRLLQPRLLIADEPTSSVDAEVRQKILDLFEGLNRDYHMSIVLITHDFDIARSMCDRILVMYGGMLVESGSAEQITSEPRHPYSMELKKCSDSLTAGDNPLYSLAGYPPLPGSYPQGCPFAERCPIAEEICREKMPPLQQSGRDSLRCHKQTLPPVAHSPIAADSGRQ